MELNKVFTGFLAEMSDATTKLNDAIQRPLTTQNVLCLIVEKYWKSTMKRV